MEMKERIKWFDRKFEFNLSNDEYESVLRRLINTPSRIKDIVNNIPAEILTKRVEGKWSIQEHIGHLIILEELHSARIDDFINGEEILHPADLQNRKTNESDFNKMELSDVLSSLINVRNDFVERLKGLSKEIKSRIAIHPRLKQKMRPIDMAYFVAEHDDHHINLINTLIKKFN